MHLHTTTVPTPVGPFTLLVGGDGVCAAGFTGRPETLQCRLDPRCRAAAIRPATNPDAVASRLLAYLEGEVEALDEVTVDQPGDLADLADPATDPLGAQAAGAACAGNHVAVIVPCHRVLRADGRLGGYGWGTHRKSWLLDHEAALVPMPGLAGSGYGR